MDFPRNSVCRDLPHRMGELGRRLFLILQYQLCRDLAGIRVNRRLLDLLFRDFGLRLIRFGGGLFRLADGLQPVPRP